MLNALQAQTEVSIYQYENTGEAVTCLAGKLEEVIYGGVNKIYNYSIKNNRKKYMKRMKQLGYYVLAAFLLTACQSYKKVPYLQGSEYLDMANVKTPLYDAHIMPKDLLTITVNTSDPDAAIPFNLTVATPITANSKNLTSQPSLQQYLVDNNGNIDFPVLGTLHIGGLTKSQAENMIKEKLKTYIKEDPIVNVRMANYKISVMGEVASPGTFTITNEKVNIMEALAMAGDMTVYGQRDKVKLIREDAQGNRQVIPLNLNDADIIVSPYYYLQQNDVVYVTPNKTKAKNAGISNSTTIWFSVVGTLVSLVSLIVTIAK